MDGLESWRERLPQAERDGFSLLRIKAGSGPESSGRRTRLLKRRVEFADLIGKPAQLLCYPPTTASTIRRSACWGLLEKHWNGAKLADVDAMPGWAGSMAWKGIRPVVELSRKVYQKGVSLSKEAMREVEARLERNPLLPKWDILIRPAGWDCLWWKSP